MDLCAETQDIGFLSIWCKSRIFHTLFHNLTKQGKSQTNCHWFLSSPLNVWSYLVVTTKSPKTKQLIELSANHSESSTLNYDLSDEQFDENEMNL